MNDQNIKSVTRFIEAHGKLVLVLQDTLILHTPFFTPDLTTTVQWFECWPLLGALGLLEASQDEQVEAILQLCLKKQKLTPHKALDKFGGGV